MKASFADLLFAREALHFCPLLGGNEFLGFCSNRGLSASSERLDKLERLGLFLPVLRIYRPDITVKIELLDNGTKYRDLGALEDGETWAGDTLKELASFDVRSGKYYESWRDEGFAWDPSKINSPHLASLESEPRRHDAFYSMFQILPLRGLLGQLTCSELIEFRFHDDGTPLEHLEQQRDFWNKQMDYLLSQRGKSNDAVTIAQLCQMISDRYYPKTQTDERRINLSMDARWWRSWDWYEYSRKWNATEVIELFGLDARFVKAAYENLAREQAVIDPLQEWYSLVRFVSLEKRAKLKGKALAAATLRDMALMLRMLYRDAFGELLAEPHELGREIFHRIPDVGPEDDPLRSLELIANDFGVNPKPNLVLFVEGPTEALAVPAIFDRLYAASCSFYGIEIVNLGGVANATGGKDNPRSALWRLVDYLHHHQTITIVLMDNEGLALHLKKGLPIAQSTYFSDRRATRREYIKLWKLSFELDNFNNEELARALSAFGNVEISPDEIERCRVDARLPEKRGKKQTIGTLFLGKTGHKLDKPRFAMTLVDFMFDPATKRAPANRPIAKFLERVAKLASRNPQPATHSMWEYNQRTGYFGTLRPGAINRRKDPFGRPRKRKKK